MCQNLIQFRHLYHRLIQLAQPDLPRHIQAFRKCCTFGSCDLPSKALNFRVLEGIFEPYLLPARVCTPYVAVWHSACRSEPIDPTTRNVPGAGSGSVWSEAARWSICDQAYGLAAWHMAGRGGRVTVGRGAAWNAAQRGQRAADLLEGKRRDRPSATTGEPRPSTCRCPSVCT